MSNIILSRFTIKQSSVVKVPDHAHGKLSVKSNLRQSRTMRSVSKLSWYRRDTRELDKSSQVDNIYPRSSIASNPEEAEDMENEYPILDTLGLRMKNWMMHLIRLIPNILMSLNEAG